MKWRNKIIIFIDPQYTSKKCSVCDAIMCVNGYRKMKCKICGTVVDRDVNASENILDKGVKYALDCFVSNPDHIMDRLHGRFHRYKAVNTGAG